MGWFSNCPLCQRRGRLAHRATCVRGINAFVATKIAGGLERSDKKCWVAKIAVTSFDNRLFRDRWFPRQTVAYIRVVHSDFAAKPGWRRLQLLRLLIDKRCNRLFPRHEQL